MLIDKPIVSKKHFPKKKVKQITKYSPPKYDWKVHATISQLSVIYFCSQMIKGQDIRLMVKKSDAITVLKGVFDAMVSEVFFERL